MHQINNVVVNLNDVENIRQTPKGLEFNFSTASATLTAKGAKFMDLINATDLEVLQDKTTHVANECGFRVSY